MYAFVFFITSINYASAQDREAKGSVKDAYGEYLIGVNVVQKGTANGTVTDIDGNFTLKVPANSTIVFHI